MEKKCEECNERVLTKSGLASCGLINDLCNGKNLWRPTYEKLQQQVNLCVDLIKKLQLLAWKDRDYEMHENLGSFLSEIDKLKQ